VPALDLKRGAFAACWLRTVEIMRGDPTLSQVIRTWRLWDGSNVGTLMDIDIASDSPILRLEPNIGAMSWFDPSSQAGFLQIKVGLIIKSFDAEDFLNLWEVVMDSLYPHGDRTRQDAIRQSLTDAGATTGQWEFAIPAAEARMQGDDGTFRCDGMMRLEVAKQFM
jgi:hypothetical protein